MKKRSQNSTTPSAKPAAARPEEDWNDDGDASTEEEWLEPSIRERDSSRIRRQMEARRKLEQLMEAKRLKNLVEDWIFTDEWSVGEEKR